MANKDKSIETFDSIDWIGEFGSSEEANKVIQDYSPNGTFDVISFQKDYPDLLTEDEAIEIAGGAVYNGNPIQQDDHSDKIWWVQWVDGHIDEYVFTIDKEHFYNVFADYATGNIPEEDKEIFEEECPFWKDFFFGKDKASANLHKVSFKKKINRDVEVYGGPGSGRYPRGSGKNPQADRRNPQKSKEPTMQEKKDFRLSRLEGLKSVPVKELKKPLSDTGIVKKIGGSEIGSAQGSCASLALAYMANKYGLDVRDHRGGDSRSLFSGDFKYILKDLGATEIGGSIFSGKAIEVSSNRDLEKALKNLNNQVFDLEKGEEAIICAGEHASAIRRGSDGEMQYLELQGNRNGWKYFEGFEYSNRFGDMGVTFRNISADGNSSIKTYLKPVTVLKLDESNTEQKDYLKDVCAYLNTDSKDQMREK